MGHSKMRKARAQCSFTDTQAKQAIRKGRRHLFRVDVPDFDHVAAAAGQLRNDGEETREPAESAQFPSRRQAGQNTLQILADATNSKDEAAPRTNRPVVCCQSRTRPVAALFIRGSALNADTSSYACKRENSTLPLR